MNKPPKDDGEAASFDRDQSGQDTAIDRVIESLRDSEALAAIETDFFARPELEDATAAILAASQDQTESGQMVLAAAWADYNTLIDTLADEELEDTAKPVKAFDEAYVYGLVHKATIYKLIGNAVRHFGELKRAESYAHDEYLDDLQEILEQEIEGLLSKATLDLDGALMRLWTTNILDPEEQAGIEEDVRNGAGLQEVLGTVYEIMTERGDSPEEAFAAIGFPA